MSRSTPPNLANTFFIIWGSLLFSILVYGGVLSHLISSPDSELTRSEPDLIQTLTLAFTFISILIVGIAIYFRRDFIKKLEQGQFVDVEDPAQAYFTPCIISWALSEAIAIYGFVLGILSLEFIYFVAFAGPAFILMLALRPQVQAIREKGAEAQRRHAPQEVTTEQPW